jgi:hypothetical protein
MTGKTYIRIATATFLGIFICGTLYALDHASVDLGKQGFTTPVDLQAIAKDNTENNSVAGTPLQLDFSQTPELEFTTRLPLYTGKATFRTRIIPDFKGRDVMLFFGTQDDTSVALAKKFNGHITVGYCLDYRTTDDIAAFKQEAGCKFPVQPILSDELPKMLDVESYPAIVEIEDGKVTVKEGL